MALLEIMDQIQCRVFKFLEEQKLLFIALGIAVICLIRFYKIDDASLWVDEAFSIFYAQQPISNIIERATQGVNPPFYNILLHYWIKLWGISELATRSLSALFSVASIVLIFKFGKRYFNLQTAVFSAGILLVSNIHQFYAHEARGFAMVSFLCLWSFYVYLDLFKSSTKAKIVLLAIINALLLYSHLVTIFLLLSQLIGAVFLFRRNKEGLKSYLLSKLLTLLLYLPWIYVIFNIYEKYTTGNMVSWLQVPGISDLKWLFVQFASNKWLIYGYLVLIVFSVFLLVQKKLFTSKQVDRNKFWILILWGFFPVLACFIFSQFIPVFWPRYLMYSSVGLILFVSYLISILPFKSSIRTLIFLFFFSISFGVQNLNPYKGENWKQAVPIVHENCTNNSLIIVSAWYCHRVFAYYYDRNSFEDYESTVSRLKDLKAHCINNGAGFENINTEGIERVILVQAHKAVVDPKNTLTKAIEADGYSQVKEQNYSGVYVAVFDK
ncbi:MAG: hypothetical protein COC01_02290 [Bacteroidetes bacterium]|nr:MAG: hypothetical protein COC01_02290 [Bacteroidota bacterium]